MGNRVISREALDSELRKRAALEPVVRWWVKLPWPTRSKIIRSRYRLHESASGTSAVLRAFYLNGEAVSTEEVAAELGWRVDRVEQERRIAIGRVKRAYRKANGGGNGKY